MRFRDRRHAGELLAARLVALDLHDPVVLGLPRGGVPVAAEVARRLGAPLDVIVARKVGAPGQAEFGIGALAEGIAGGAEIEVHDPSLLRLLGIDDARYAGLVDIERVELRRRVDRYRGTRVLPDVRGRDVVVVDDGLATGVTAEASLRSLRGGGPHRLVLAVPVGAPDSIERLGRIADDVVAVLAPGDFDAVGRWYVDFGQTTDAEVTDLLGTLGPHGGDGGAGVT